MIFLVYSKYAVKKCYFFVQEQICVVFPLNVTKEMLYDKSVLKKPSHKRCHFNALNYAVVSINFVLRRSHLT